MTDFTPLTPFYMMSPFLPRLNPFHPILTDFKSFIPIYLILSLLPFLFPFYLVLPPSPPYHHITLFIIHLLLILFYLVLHPFIPFHPNFTFILPLFTINPLLPEVKRIINTSSKLC